MLKNIIEALLFASGDGLPWEELLAQFSGEYTEKEIKSALKQLQNEFSDERGIFLIKYNNKWQFQSNPAYGQRIADALQPIKEKELSKTLLEVLSIIAYKQPITRAEIEDVRGVSSEYAVAMLQKFALIDVIGRKESIGRPALFGTTDEFLKKFRLESLDDLPDYEELLIELRQNFDRFYQKSDALFREHSTGEDEAAAAIATTEPPTAVGTDFFEKEDGTPQFLQGEDVAEFSADETRSDPPPQAEK